MTKDPVEELTPSSDTTNDDVHPAQVVTLEVAEEHVASRGQAHVERLAGRDAHLGDLSDACEHILIDAQTVGRDRQPVGGEIGADHDELVRGGPLVVDVEDDRPAFTLGVEAWIEKSLSVTSTAGPGGVWLAPEQDENTMNAATQASGLRRR